MAGKLPYSELSDVLREPFGSSSYNFEELPPESNRDDVVDVLPISKAWSKITECSLEGSSSQRSSISLEERSGNQIQQQYMFTVEQCITDLKQIRRANEEMFIHVKKTTREKVDQMLKAVKQSFEYMNVEGTKQIQLKCEKIGHILTRIEKQLENGTHNISSENITSNKDKDLKNQKFREESLKEKSRIEKEVEAVIQRLNKNREHYEEIVRDLKDDIQQQTHNRILIIEKSLELQDEQCMTTVQKKITELRKALANLQHLSKFS